MQTTFVSVPFIPSSPLSGNESSRIYRGKNMILRGLGSNVFYACYNGSENLSEPIPSVALTGTLAFSPASLVVTGTTTAFLDELHLGQMILANEEVLVVSQLLTQTTFLANRLPQSTETTATGYRLPVLFDLDIKRGALLSGNGVIFDKGTIIAVGSGALYVNGAVLGGDSLTATRTAQVALYDSATQTYDVQNVGFANVPSVAYADVSINASGGVKNMALGYYSFRVAYYSTITGGYSNSCDTLLAGGTAGYQITVANSTFTIDFSTDQGLQPGRAPNADGYIIYGSAFSGSSTVSAVNSVEGGWFEVSRVAFADLVTDTHTFEYIDSDLGSLVSFDNDGPPDAEFVTNLTGYAVLVSTEGQGVDSTGRELATSPGPYISPMKATNFSGYPATMAVPTEKGEVIIGQVSAAGRIFVLTSNTLQAVTPTGLPSAPFTTRPFWRRGFQGKYNLCFVDDTLYGFTTAGMFRSIATGDEGQESHIFASDVETQTADWHGGYVFVAHDPKNEQVCFFYSASRQNGDGYWESDILPYSLRQQQWMPTVVLSSSTRDMIVSGCCTCAGRLYFIAGGRRAGTTNQHDTFMYDEPSGEAVPYFLAWNYADMGAELTAKQIRKLRPKGKFTDAAVQVYVTTPDTDVDVTDLEDGTNASFEYSLTDSTTVKQYGIQKCRVRNGMMVTARIEGTWDGAGDPDQFHELGMEFDISGQLR